MQGIEFRPNGLITLTTDFGTRDSYAAELKGVLIAAFPRVQLVDVTHEIPPQDIRGGAFRLARAVTAFPPGTVHVAIVDPGVGTQRRPAVVVTSGQALVGPDNGLLSWAAGEGAEWREADCRELWRDPPCPTFHGRDVFAPTAAAIASGRLSPAHCGPALADPVVLCFPRPEVGAGSVRAEVLAVDHFGNLVLAVRAVALTELPADGTAAFLRVGRRVFPGTWGVYALSTGLVVHGDSSGYLEVALPGGSAASLMGAVPGTVVRMRWST